MKKIILMILIGVIVMNSTGCQKLISHEKLAKQLLEKKYQSEFEIKKVEGTNLLDGYYNVIAYQKDSPEILFEASIESDGSGESDNYICKLVAQKVSDKVAKNLDPLKGFYYIFSTPVVDNVLLDNPDMTVEEYMKISPSTPFNIYFNYCPDEENIDIDTFYNVLSQMFKGLECISGNIYFYIVDEGMIGNIQEYKESHDKCYYDYQQMTDSYYRGTIEFENGKIKTSKNDIKMMMENKK